MNLLTKPLSKRTQLSCRKKKCFRDSSFVLQKVQDGKSRSLNLKSLSFLKIIRFNNLYWNTLKVNVWMCPLAACRNGVGYRSIEAFKCFCGSILTPSFRQSVVLPLNSLWTCMQNSFWHQIKNRPMPPTSSVMRQSISNLRFYCCSKKIQMLRKKT